MKLFASLAALLTIATPALAGVPVTVKADIVDADGVVTLGEIFAGAGAAGATPVASRAQVSVMLNAQAVRVAAARAGLDWANAEGLRTIVVRGEIAAAPGAVAARGNVDVLTWARSIQAGEMVQPADLVWGKAAAAPADAPNAPDAVIGLAARRPLLKEAEKLEKESLAFEKKSEEALHQHHRWAQAMTAVQIAISLAAITLLTKKRWLQYASYSVAGVGTVLAGLAWFHI